MGVRLEWRNHRPRQGLASTARKNAVTDWRPWSWEARPGPRARWPAPRVPGLRDPRQAADTCPGEMDLFPAPECWSSPLTDHREHPG